MGALAFWSTNVGGAGPGMDRVDGTLSGGLRSLPAPTLAEIRQVFRDYHKSFGRYPNLVRPRRFSEKIQWRKLFDLDPIYAEVTDKLTARDFIAARVGAACLPPLLWTGGTPDDVPFDRLEPPYVLKCSHGSGFNVVVYDRATLDVAATREKLRGWLAINYGNVFREPGYIPLRPRLLAERMMLEPDGTPALEHKVFVFGGKARMIHSVAVKRERTRFELVPRSRLASAGLARHQSAGRDGPGPAGQARSSPGAGGAARGRI